MRTISRLALPVAAVFFVTACQESSPSSATGIAAQLDANFARSANANANSNANSNARVAANFVSPMDPRQEVQANEVLSNASGNAVYTLSRDGQSLEYRVIVAGANPLTQGHIHLGARGANGNVVATLFNFAPIMSAVGVSRNGVIATGTITAADLRAQLAGAPLSDLLDALRSGNAYTNVHTVVFPQGEVRGQIQAVGAAHKH